MTDTGRPQDLDDDQLDAVTGGVGATVGPITTNMASIQGMDLETAMMAVQSQRAGLLETQLKDQMAGVQKRNESIADLNTVLGAFNKSSSLTANLKADAKIGSSAWDSLLKESGAKDGAALSQRTGLSGLSGDMTKGQFDSAISQVKGMIDAQSNSQQMDMLRLQSLSNKRNEAFDVMTNFIKKMQESRSSIVGNMR